MRFDLSLAVALLIACQTHEPKHVAAASPRTVASKAPLLDATSDDVVDACVEAPSFPPAVMRTGNVWPRHAFDRAEAVTFNWFPEKYLPDFSNYAYNEFGWNHHLSDRRPISVAQATKAVGLLLTLGEFELTGCTFARHAVVLYDGDTPVASINVCFECGAVLAWPSAASTHATPAQQQQRLVPWETFFRVETELPVKRSWL